MNDHKIRFHAGSRADFWVSYQAANRDIKNSLRRKSKEGDKNFQKVLQEAIDKAAKS